MTRSTTDLLKEIQQKLQVNELSVLVGAGFSKNVSNKLFPSWWQLLKDMVMELRGAEYLESYKASGTTLSEFDYIEKKINHFIDQVGPLKVATLFLERKGYREALDHYIERRTPFLRDRNILCYYDKDDLKELVLTDEDLEVHKKLVSLPWNNIYTTNYDNLLESCIDEDIDNHLKQQKTSQQTKIEAIRKEIKEKTEQKEAKEKELDGKESEKSVLLSQISIGERTEANLEQVDKQIQELTNALGSLRDDIFYAEKEIDSIGYQLTKIEQQLKTIPTRITSSTGLAIKKNQNIIKLHGSIRKSEEEEFGFDNDAHKHYVITEEDFSSYPQRHEAFTQLMRISLLQESFCLIGFSGVDPNFLAWIGWVRDILFKADPTIDQSKTKIYLISLTDRATEPDKVTFYNNHKISPVPLLSDEAINFLEVKLGRTITDRSSFKEVLALFFDFLNLNNSQGSIRAVFEVAMRRDFEQLCERLPNFMMHPQENIEISENDVCERLDSIAKLTGFNRFPIAKFPEDDSRRDFLRNFGTYQKCVSKKENTQALAAVVHLIKSQYLPHSALFTNIDEKPFDKLLKIANRISQKLYYRLMLLDLSDAIWNADSGRIENLVSAIQKNTDDEISQEFTYLRALNEAFAFRFHNLKEILGNWYPNGYLKVCKSGLMSLFDCSVATSILDNSQKNLQDQLYELELNSHLQVTFVSRPEHEGAIRLLKDQGLTTIKKSLEYLLPKNNSGNILLVPFGADTFKISHGFFASKVSSLVQSLQFFGLLYNSGFQLCYERFQFIKPEQVYPLALLALKHHPIPVLFYMLQYRGEKYLKRLGQDYAYARLPADLAKIIFQNLSASYFNNDTPNRIKANIPAFLSEFIVVIDPVDLQPFFRSYWKQLRDQGVLFIDRKLETNHFIENALGYVQDPMLISEMISDCISAFPDSNEKVANTVIQYLYHLALNPVLNLKSAEIKTNLKLGFETIILQVPKNPLLIFALGNLDKLLSDNERLQVFQQVEKMDFNKIRNVRLWRILLYFVGKAEDFALDLPEKYSHSYQMVIGRIKQAIIESPSLWDAGFKPGGLNSHSEYIQISRIRKGNHEHGLEWTKLEAQQVYKKLSLTLNRIEDWLLRPGDKKGLFDAILDEMRDFLAAEQHNLQELPDYESNQTVVDELYRQQRDFTKLMYGLISDDHNKVLTALNELMTILYSTEDFKSYQIPLVTVLNKILLQSQPGLEECLKYISNLIYYFRKKKDSFIQLKDYLWEILGRYQQQMPQDIEEPFYYEQLVTIAYVLSEWGEEGRILIDYLSLLEKSRYNNMKYRLRQQLELDE